MSTEHCNNPLHADYYADDSSHYTAEVIENVKVAQATWRVRFRCPDVAAKCKPGQFIMLKITDRDDPLIGRPLAVFDVIGDANGVPTDLEAVYLVKGNLTTRLVDVVAGQYLDVWGPLGNGFLPQETRHLIMVAGGIGQTPFVTLAREYLGLANYDRDCPQAQKVTLCYGARNEHLLAGVDTFESVAGLDVRLCTDDGSRGHHGLVTELLEQVLSEDKEAHGSSEGTRVVCCGPEPMMEAVAKVSKSWAVQCQVSLETPMACGIGICFTCVTKVVQNDGSWDYKRTCVEGPVFDASKIVWH